MKALTIRQPYASLIALGEKHYETRSWRTSYRGPLAIHAGKHIPTRDDYWMCQSNVWRVLDQHGLSSDVKKLPRSAVLCIVQLEDCIPAEQLTETHVVSGPERMFGDYRPGRWGWKLSIVEVFAHPIPASGRLGFWEWSQPA